MEHLPPRREVAYWVVVNKSAVKPLLRMENRNLRIIQDEEEDSLPKTTKSSLTYVHAISV